MSSATTFGLNRAKDFDPFAAAGCFDGNSGSPGYGKLLSLSDDGFNCVDNLTLLSRRASFHSSGSALISRCARSDSAMF